MATNQGREWMDIRTMITRKGISKEGRGVVKYAKESDINRIWEKKGGIDQGDGTVNVQYSSVHIHLCWLSENNIDLCLGYK